MSRVPIHENSAWCDRRMNESDQSVSRAAATRAPSTGSRTALPPEPPFLRFAGILWRRRWLIVLGSLLPALAVALALYFWPVSYTTTFVYERPLTESEYNVLLRRFYSSENLGKIVTRLRENGNHAYATRLEQVKTEQALQKLIQFRVSPAYPTRLQTTDPNTSEQISQLKAKLCYIDITGGSENDMPAVSEVITANFENVLPIYDIRNDLQKSIQEIKKSAAEIEDSRFTLTVDLQKEKGRLEKLSTSAGASDKEEPGNLVLQFTEVADSNEFLPLPYQIRAVQSKIIDMQETLRSDEEMHRYYLKVLELNGRLLGEITQNLMEPYTVQQFLGFLDTQLAACQEEELVDYIQSYIRKTQNLAFANIRAGERPVVYPVAKHVVQRSVLTSLVFLMLMTFAAVALESGRDRRLHARPASAGATS